MNTKKIMDIEPENFYPKPKVKSSLVCFEPKNKFFNFSNSKNLEKVTDIFFQNKRKMIKKPLNILFKNSSIIIDRLDLNEKSNVLLMGCEGDADKDLYEKLLNEGTKKLV